MEILEHLPYSFFEQVVQSYEEEGFSFLLRVFNEPNYLEDLTGLTEMHQQTIDAEVIIYNYGLMLRWTWSVIEQLSSY